MAIETKLFTVTGTEELAKRVRAIEDALIAGAPAALEAGAKPVLEMMLRLVSRDTGTLARTIRFSLGAARGGVKTFKKNPRSTRRGRTYIAGYITAGDETTIKRGNPPGRKRKKGGRAPGAKGWQLARLIEFGTVKMSPKPYFFPSWRSQKAKVRTIIAIHMNRAFKKGGGKALLKENTPSVAA